MVDIVGRTLSKRYYVRESLGRGGMAEVYKVWDTERTAILVLKLLREDLAEDLIFLRRFQREADTLAKLDHPNIVRFYGLEQDDILAFILMDYIDGENLRTEIFRSQGKGMEYDRILEVTRPVCWALQYAHTRGVIHCDIKPGNILIGKGGGVFVSDFGIARMVDAATSTLMGAGTPAYMSPEQIKGKDPTPQMDVYSLGVVLYEMLTGGERPFVGESAQTTGTTAEKVIWEKMHLEAPSPQKYRADIPREVEAVVVQCLSKEAKARYSSVLDLLNALERAILSRKMIGPEVGKIRTAAKVPAQPVLTPAEQPGALPVTREQPASGGSIPQPRAAVKTPIWVWIATAAIAVIVLLIGAGLGIKGNGMSGIGAAPAMMKVGLVNKAADYPGSVSITATVQPGESGDIQSKAPTLTTQFEETMQANATYQAQVSAAIQANATATAIALLTATPRPEIVASEEVEKAMSQGLPYVNMVTLLSLSEPLLWSNGWCTTTKEILENNIENMSWRFILDGSEVPLDSLSQTVDERDDGAWCMDYTALLDHWPIGKHWLQVERITLDPINDGWSDFPVGTEVDDNFVYIIGQEDANQDPLDWPKIFEYTFSDDAYGNWRNKEDNEWWLANSNLADGKFILNVEKTRQGMNNRYSYALIETDNFYLSVDARRLSGPQNQACYGIWFNGDEDSYYTIKVCEDQTFSVYMLYNGTWHTIKDRFASKAIHNNQMNQVAILAKGDHFTLYINGEIVGEFTNQQLVKGEAGFFVELDQGINASYEFDNLILRAPYYP